MEINGKNYTIAELKEKMLKTHQFSYEKIESGSLENTLDEDPIATTNPNLHMRYDASKVVKRGEGEVFDRIYTFLGYVGTKIYSCKRKFFHDEEDTTTSEIP